MNGSGRGACTKLCGEGSIGSTAGAGRVSYFPPFLKRKRAEKKAKPESTQVRVKYNNSSARLRSERVSMFERHERTDQIDDSFGVVGSLHSSPTFKGLLTQVASHAMKRAPGRPEYTL